jgi:hypothetical protein
LESDVYVYGNIQWLKFMLQVEQMLQAEVLATDDIQGLLLTKIMVQFMFAKNETWWNSGNPESGASKTGAASYFYSRDYQI